MGSTNRNGMLLIVAAALLWGTSGATGRYLSQVHTMSPFAIAFYRLAIGAIALATLRATNGSAARALTCMATRPRERHVNLAGHCAVIGLFSSVRSLRSNLAGVLVLVGVGMALYQAAFFVAVSVAGVSLATLVALGMAPVLVSVLSICILKQAPEGRVLLSLVAALAGLVLLVGAPTVGVDQAVVGASLATLSALGFAVVTLLGRWLSTSVASPVTTFAGFAVGAAVLLPMAVATGLSLPSDGVEAGLLVYLGVGPTALAYSAFFLGMRWVAPSASSILTLVEPLTATLLAVALFQERLTPVGLSGAALLSLAVLALCLAPAAGRHARKTLVQTKPSCMV